MEIGDNGEKSSQIHQVASVPVLFGSKSEKSQGESEGQEDGKKNRRVSFAASSQFLEPINPFDILGEKERKKFVFVVVDFERERGKSRKLCNNSTDLSF